MLCANGFSVVALRFLSGGAQQTHQTARSRVGWSMTNCLAFGRFTSYPPGRRSTAIKLAVSDGGIGSLTLAGASSTAGIDARGTVDGTLTGTGSASAPITGLKDSPGLASGVGTASADVVGRGTIAGIAKIGTITQDDVTGSVLDVPVEGSITVREALRVLLAVAAGKTSIVDLGGGAATVTFRDTEDTTDRLVATMAGSERDSVTLDVT